MNLDQIVSVTIERQTRFPSRLGFGVPAVIDINTTQPNDVDVFTDPQELLDAGFLVTDPAYLAALAIFSQNPKPTQMKLLKRAANVAQVNTYQVVGTGDGNYTITINGVDFTFVASSSTATAIRDGLVSAINGGSEPVTAAPVSTDQLTVTADVPGVPFTSAVASPGSDMTDTATTANVGAASELARLRQVDDDWYFLLSTDRTRVFQEQLSSSIESAIKLFVYATDEADSKDLAPGGDTTSLLAVLQAANRDRSAGIWTKTANLANYPDAAWVGKMAPKDPGSATWKFKTVSGPLPDDELTSTEENNIQTKNGNIYTTVAGVAIFAEGVVASGEFIDIIRGTDLLQARIQENVFARLINEDKIPFDNGGIEAIATEVESTLVTEGVDGGILRGGEDAPVVTVPDISAVPQGDRANRELNDVEFEGFYAGAIHKVAIQGRLTV